MDYRLENTNIKLGKHNYELLYERCFCEYKDIHYVYRLKRTDKNITNNEFIYNLTFLDSKNKPKRICIMNNGELNKLIYINELKTKDEEFWDSIGLGDSFIEDVPEMLEIEGEEYYSACTLPPK